jgi:hypothetical protein
MDSDSDIDGPENQSKHKSQSRVVMNQLTCLSILLAHFASPMKTNFTP